MRMKKVKSVLFKTLPFSLYKNKVLKNLKEAVKEMHLIKEGKLIARDAHELFNEL